VLDVLATDTEDDDGLVASVEPPPAFALDAELSPAPSPQEAAIRSQEPSGKRRGARMLSLDALTGRPA